MRFYRTLLNGMRRWRTDSEGSIPIEGLMAFIFLGWWYLASFQFFDALRQRTINTKAAYTIADLITRETGPDPANPGKVPVNAAYINGIKRIFDFLTNSAHQTDIRVSSIYWDSVQRKNRIGWSYGTGNRRALTDATLQASAGRIPTMPTGDTVIMVETWMAYNPPFGDLDQFWEVLNIGSPNDGIKTTLDSQWFNLLVVARPRFSSCIPWDNNPCGGGGGGGSGIDMPDNDEAT